MECLMVAGGARCPGLGWRGGEVGMEWWHYLETESFYRNISGSSVTRPHCAHRHQLGHTTTLHPHTGARSQDLEVHFRGGREYMHIFMSSRCLKFKLYFIHHSISFQSKTKDWDRVWKQENRKSSVGLKFPSRAKLFSTLV